MKNTILFVDDEKSSLSTFKSLFRRKFNVITADSGEEGLVVLNSEPIHVVITDQRMPDMLGIDFLKKVKIGWPDIKCIILTAYNDNEVLKEAINEIGIFWYLTKPFDVEQMEQVINKAESTYQAEKKLKESEEKFRGVFESMTDVFTRSNMDGICEIVSPSIYQLMGYTPEEWLGRDLADFYADPSQRDVITKRLLKTRKVENFVFDAIRKDGKQITVSTNAKIIYNKNLEPLHVEGNIRDITEQKRAESEHDKLFNVSFDLLCIAGFDGYFKELNPVWERIMGYTLDELYEKPFSDFIHPDDVEITTSQVNKLFHGELSFDFENRYITKEGEILDLSWTATSIPGEKLMYCIARDVTEKKQNEQKIIEYQLRLKNLAKELTLAEEKMRKQIAEDLHDYVGQMLFSVRMEMTRIIEEEESLELTLRMKNLSQVLLKAIQATRAAIFDLSPPQLSEMGLFAAVHDWLKEQIDNKYNIITSIKGNDEHQNLDEKNRYLVFRCIKELANNVVKHAKANRLDIIFKANKDILKIIVQDDGVGFQYSAELLRLKSNSYGLFFIQERLSDLGGTMTVDSEINIGTKITIRIPIN